MLKFEMTREQAIQLGLLTCGNCGWPETDGGIGKLPRLLVRADTCRGGFRK